jgi:hypothetical protein
MADHEEERCNSRQGSRLRAVMVLLLCLCIGAAVLHANLSPKLCQALMGEVGEGLVVYSVGWPVVYGNENMPSVLPLRWPLVDNVDARCLWANMLVAAVLIASPVLVWRSRRSNCLRSGQFALSELFLATTATAMVLSLLALERAYGSALMGDMQCGVYCPLRVYPWYDQVGILIGIVYALILAIKTLAQAVFSIIRRLHRAQSN